MNYDQTVLVGSVMLVSIFIVTLIFCLCAGKDLVDRVNSYFDMSKPETGLVNVTKYDYESIGGPALVQKKLAEAMENSSSEMVVIEEIQNTEENKKTTKGNALRPQLEERKLNRGK